MLLSDAEACDRFRAAILGFAVGDALGFPLRGVPTEALERLPALAEDFANRPRGKFSKGQFSDDTQLLLATCESVVLEGKVDGRSAAAHYAWLWKEGIVLEPPRSASEAAARLLEGSPWMSAGAPLGVVDASVLSRAVALGLWHARAPDRIAHDASVLAVITHKDPSCAAAVAAVARAVAMGLSGEPFTPQSLCEELATCASTCDADFAEEVRHLPRALEWETSHALAQLRRIGVPAAVLDSCDGLPPHPLPVLLIGLYVAMRVPTDFREALSVILRLGGEADVAAGVCGALLGSQLGCDAIPARLRRNVLYAEHLVATSDRLFNAARAKVAVPAEVVTVRRR